MKNTKIVALVATAALLVLGAAFTSMAATYNWYQVDGIWHCKDKNGDDITQDWAKSGNDMYYLDENGEMVTESFLDVDDDYFYVDADGKMVKNDWKKVENDDNEGDEYNWYYFSASGKAKKGKASASDNKPVTINGKKYMFAEDGKMLYGWINGSKEDYEWEDANYYAGDADDGAIRTGWQKIDVLDDTDPTLDWEEQTYWFYFGTNGQKTAAKSAEILIQKSINGKKYAFDQYGVMRAEWEQSEATATSAEVVASVSSYAWFQDAEIGAKLKKGWFRVVPNKNINATANDDEESHWFYAKGAGALAANEVKSINGKKYAFNEKGEMISGLWKLDLDNIAAYINDTDNCIDSEAKVTDVTSTPFDVAGEALYFFGDEETDGSMKTGTIKTEIDGDDYTFVFDTTGSNKYKAHKGIKNNSWYTNGSKLTADAELKYQAFEATILSAKVKDITVESTTATNWGTFDPAKTYVLVSSSGVIIKSGTKKDADDHKYKVTDYKATCVTE